MVAPSESEHPVARLDEGTACTDPELFKAALNCMPAAVCIIDAKDLRVAMVNPAYQAIAPGKQMVGRALEDFWPDTGENFTAICRRVLETGEVLCLTDELNTIRRGADGPPETAYFNWSLRRLRLPGDQRWGLLKVGWETTGRKAAEDQLRASRDVMRQLVERSPFGVYTVDGDFRIAQVSFGAQKAFRNVSPLIGRDFAEAVRIIWPEPFATEVIGRFWHTLKTGEPYRAPSLVERRRDIGEVEAYDWKIEHLMLPDGRPGVVCHFYDFSERQQFEAALRESERKYRIFADNTFDFEFWRGADGKYVYVSPSCERLCNHAASEFLADPSLLGRLVHKDDRAQFEQNNLAATCEAVLFEYRIVQPNGTIRWVAHDSHPVYDENGNALGVRGSIREISKRRRMEEALRRAQGQLRKHAAKLERIATERTIELRATNEELETYVYSVAHHLRAPLRSMSGYSQILLDEHAKRLTLAGKSLLNRIRASSLFIDNMLLDLIAHGRITHDDLTLEPVALGPAWEKAIQICASESAAIQPEIETIGPMPSVVAHEPTLVQILANLLDNSLKFTRARVIPHVRFWAEEGESVVRILIQDNGIGIPKSQHQRVFRVFERLNGAKYPGTGIGLSIVLKGIERMGGKVGVESVKQGTRFWIDLPKPASK